MPSSAWSRISGRALAVVAAVLLLAATFFLVRDGEETRTVTAHFPRAVSVFTGTDVRILGVNVGTRHRRDARRATPCGSRWSTTPKYRAARPTPRPSS